ncbi:uncharacterized protein LOC108022422 [Drosophila biarmipes]|uniref:uncharacterized protein LOC108022422 n=1 Tax=Drosophila biarmipes TaxID=125945 RepID=UPI0007E7E3EC|nr:uncharacterized protein LOC108022422 [Drosophila biarmipes]
MSSDQAFRAFPWLVLLPCCFFLQWCEAAPQIQDEVLQQLKELNLSQAKLIAANSTVKCTMTPSLCDWQLHLYEGHEFSVPLDQTVESITTKAPSNAGQEIFELTPQDSGLQLYIVAEIEPKSRRERRRKGKLRRPSTFNHLSKQKFVLLAVQ